MKSASITYRTIDTIIQALEKSVAFSPPDTPTNIVQQLLSKLLEKSANWVHAKVFVTSKRSWKQTHRIHVWYIYLHLP